MATPTDLAIRTLQKMQVLGTDEQPSAADLAKTLEKVRGVHAYLKVEGLLRWTLANIPDYAEEPYVLMAASKATSDFGVAENYGWWQLGLRMIQSAVNLPAIGETRAEYF